MSTIRTAILLVAATVAADQPPALRVIRTTPGPEASPTSVVTITFDRPVAGSLDGTVDARSLVTIRPALSGTVEWRDPVTIRLRPDQPLTPGTSYQVTVSQSFTALDGSRLATPHQFNFRVSGPAVLAGLPVSAGDAPQFVTPKTRFSVVLSSTAPTEDLTRLIYIELGQGCGRTGTIRFRPAGERSIPADAPWQLREAGGWDRDRSADSLRRVVDLEPATPLPLACNAALVTPTAVDLESPGAFRRWPFRTYGPFRLAESACSGGEFCPAGPIRLVFSTPVRGADLLRRVTILPKVPFTVGDTNDVRDRWILSADLKPRTGYLVQVDPALTDVFGQKLQGNPRQTVVTTGFEPSVSYLNGRLTIERNGLRTLPITHVNVDTVEVISAAVPESLEAKLLSQSWYAWGEDWNALSKHATRRRVAVRSIRDRHGVYGVAFPAPDARSSGAPTLYAVKISSPRLPRPRREGEVVAAEAYQPIALIQVTDLGIHAKIGREEGTVWVTGVSDGKPRAGAAVRVRDRRRNLLAEGVTDQSGLFRFASMRRPAVAADSTEEYQYDDFEGYVEARLDNDRALVGVNQYDAELSPWQFNVSGAWGRERYPMAGALFTERGIYRPGDSVFAKAIVRTGALGSLKVPQSSDSVRLVFQDRDGGTLLERVVAPSAFGTAAPSIRLPDAAPLGQYAVTASLRREGQWQEIARTEYRVAEYRAPEFLVEVTADTVARQNGDRLPATVSARYLFGAPMARAKVTWSVRQRSIEPWDLTIPGTDGYFVAARGWWWEEWSGRTSSSVSESKADSLDASGQLRITAPLELANPALPARVSVEAVVTDVNRQTVYGAAAVVVHPTAYYIAAKPAGSYFWPAGAAQTVEVMAVRPDGRRVAEVAVAGVLIRREWHQVRRENNGYSELVGEWVQDTVDRCQLRTGSAPATCRFTPKAAGSYIVAFSARDPGGRDVTTSFYRWVTGPGWVPWADESQFKMDVVPDRSRYTVGDTATVLFASPFTNADAWITVEREGVIEQRRIRITDGATTLRLPVTEAWAPNAFVSIVVARGRSAAPGPLDDPGRPTIRVGYAEVRVTPERKRLAVALAADKQEYRPGDRAVFTASVTDAGRGARSEVTLWAVDEGVLSLTGFKTPDPIDLLYQPRGLGLRLGSNLTSVAPQVRQGDKGRNPGGGGGEGAADVLRSRFKTTAFFLGSVVTDNDGTGSATVTLPDNLTTFRVMAVAVTAGDRFGNGQSPLLVTRPLLARPSLPRFVRPGDRFTAGVVVNHRVGGTPTVEVKAEATGIKLSGRKQQRTSLEAGRGREVRFDFLASDGDSAAFRFDVSGAGDRDAVRLAIPVRSAFRPRIAVVAGLVRDTAQVTLDVSPDADPARSRVTLSLGTSPLALLRGYADDLRAYPYLCTEQMSAVALPILALYRARVAAGGEAGDTVRLRSEAARALELIMRRQRSDGAIGLWSATDWSSPWMTANAGEVLLEARAAGFVVPDTVIAAMVGYLTAALEREENMALTVGLRDTEVRATLTERVAMADFLSRAGKRNQPLENELVRRLGQLAPDDRMRFAVTLVRSGDTRMARRIVEPFWSLAVLEGRTVSLPDSLESRFYLRSAVRTPAYLLLATLAVEPTHPLVTPLLETVVSRGRRREPEQWWNTQDHAMAVRAVDAWQRRFPAANRRPLEVRSGGRTVFATGSSQVAGDSVRSLRDLLRGRKPGPLPLEIAARGEGDPGFFYLTLTETPRVVPVNPEDRGIRVERWYEDYRTGKPITSVAEGELVRVRLRVTVPSERSFVVLDDPLPAGLEAIDLSLRTVGGIGGPGQTEAADQAGQEGEAAAPRWSFGSWDSGWWSPFDHRELRDDRVVYAARLLWGGSYTASYLARATTPGTFIRPQAHAEEMYNPAVFGRSDGGTFIVTPRVP
ncbi:MAG: alpha-2-macroglobulin family protein [Gemmatimonadales bacterium]